MYRILMLSTGLCLSASLAVGDVQTRPGLHRIAPDRAGRITTTLSDRSPFGVGAGAFCTQLGDFGCLPGSILATVPAPAGGARDRPEMCGGEPCGGEALAQFSRFRDRVRVPLTVARAAADGTVYFVREIQDGAGVSTSVVKLIGSANPAAGAVEVSSADIYVQTGSGRYEGLVYLDRDVAASAVARADLRTRGRGRLTGWWVVETPAGVSSKVARFRTRAAANGRVELTGPRLSDLPQILAGRHVLRLTVDQGAIPDVVELSYLPAQAAAPVALAFSVSGDVVRWTPRSIAGGAGVMFDGPAMGRPKLVPFAPGQAKRPKGATQAWVVDGNGARLTRPAELRP